MLIKIQDKSLGVSAEDKAKFSRQDSLFSNYKEFVRKYQIDKLQLVSELKEYAQLYREHISADIVEQNIDKNNAVDRLNVVIFSLETTTIIPYMLYILRIVDSQHERQKIFRYLESFIIRRIITRAVNKNYNQLFTTNLIGNEINSAEKLQTHIDKLADKTNHMPDDSQLKFGFETSVITNRQARGILYLMEKTIRDDDSHATALLGVESYSLEHLMPKKWQNNWNAPPSEDERNERNRLLLTLGNLTIIPGKLNSSIRDSDWETKKKGKGSLCGLDKYSSGIEILGKYLKLECWDEKNIRDRATDLFKIAAATVWQY